MSSIPTSMKAAVLKELDHPIVIETVPVPTPQPRDLLVKVRAASLCHSDVSIISGAFGNQFLPLILGHEAVGTVVDVGPEAESYGFKVGQMVGAPLWHGMCLECLECKKFGPEFCPNTNFKGTTCAGYFSEYSLVDAASAVVVRDDEHIIDDERRFAPLFCAGITVWDALERAKLAMGETVAIVGAGGLGQIAIQYAASFGVKVIALDVRDEQLTAVHGKGLADIVVNIKSSANIATEVKEKNGGSLVDVAIVTSGVGAAYQTGLSILSPLGRLIAVGLPHDPLSIHATQVTGNCQTIIGAKVPGQKGSKRCIDYSLRKKILPQVNPRRFKLEDINEMVELMKAGKVEEGRMVVEF